MNIGAAIMIIAVGAFAFVLIVCGLRAYTHGYEGEEREAVNHVLKLFGIICGIVFTIGVFISVIRSLDKPQYVIRTVELHYINGEVETRKFHGTTYHEPTIEPGYTPYYYDVTNSVYGVVRFKVLKVDTIPTSK